MKRLLLTALFLAVAALPAAAQDANTRQADSLAATDSASLIRIRTELAEARLAEASLRMEIERLRMPLTADSAARADYRRRIDSLRRVSEGFPVVVEGDTLFRIYAKRGGYTPAARAEMNAETISELGRRLNLKPDSVYVEQSDITSDLMYGEQVLTSFTDHDAMWENTSRQVLADSIRLRVVEKLRTMHEVYGWLELAKRGGLFLLLIVGQWILILLTNWIFRKGRRRICRNRVRFRPIRIQSYELLDSYRQVRMMLFASHIARYVVILLQLVLSVPLLFAIFPSTRTLAYQLFSYIWSPLRGILVGVVEYIPNLFTIAVIWLVIRYIIKGLRYMADEVHTGKLTMRGFYPEWAQPTFQIIRFLLYAFMIAMIYPHLPGYESSVFKGISIFVGLIISLGSSTVVSNILAGLIITYMRPFRIGDRIRLHETTGNVIEKTTFVTRVRTPKNEVVTIPNSFIMSSQTVNYSASARDYGLLIHTEVTIGYDVPWRKVHSLLIEAARATPGVEADPEPFVLETGLSDYYPVYQLHACIREADRMAHILSDLNQHIQDRFAEADVEIMSPAYTALRNGNGSTIPKK